MRWLVGLLTLALAALGAQAQQKKAFVVGVRDYAELTDLTRTLEDAAGYTNVLRDDLGFTVTTLASNPKRTDFSREFGKFLENIKSGDEVVFVFSGHGWSDGAENFLALSDARKDASEFELKEETVALSRSVLRQIKDRGPSVVIAIIDACRDNPFDSGTKNGFDKGLARVDAVEGTLVIFAAGERQKALDRLGNSDTASYSLFTRTLLPKLRDPNVPLMQALDDVRTDVEKAASAIGHKQRPALYSDVSIRYCLSGRCSGAAVPAPVDQEAAYWNAISAGTRDTDKCGEYRAYLKSWPTGRYAGAAQRMVAALCEPTTPGPSLASSTAPPVSPPRATAQGKTAGTVFRDPFKSGSGFGPEMVVVPAGNYLQGSPSTETGRDADEDDVAGDGGRPRRVTIGYDIAVGRTEVTVDQYKAFAAATGRVAGGDCYADLDGDGSWAKTKEATWKNPGFAQGGDHPVVCVSWDDAKAYARWLSGETGETYRLLSEAEWEYAARAGEQGAYFWGSSVDAACTYANVADASAKKKFSSWTTASCTDDYLYTAPVGAYTANGFKVNDMTGNVSEWTEDCYADSYAGAPSDGSARTTSTCSFRVVRGGSWYYTPQYRRAANRDGGTPESRDNTLGFRLARTLPR